MNSFGRIFSLTVFGESHGPLIGVIINGCPPGLAIKEEDFKPDLDRRRSGAPGTTPRQEDDKPEFLSGFFNGYTTGAPLTIGFRNKNVKSKDYSSVQKVPRPGHADFVASQKFKGYNDFRGGGHFSGRLTLALVAAGVVAKKILKDYSIKADLIQAGGMEDIEQAIAQAMKDNDSIGGIVECKVGGLPVGLGEPFFDSVESLLSHMVFAIPAIKGIEFGSGFSAASMRGSEHNDPIITREGKTSSNNAGGINGGITNSNELVFRVAIKPTSSTAQPQKSIDLEKGQLTEFEIKGRHDLCIALRVPVVVEAVTACVLCDLEMIQSAWNNQEKK